MPLDMDTSPSWHRSTCPHDCPSTCALEVERINDKEIGRVRGSTDNSYTAGVICAKVARYKERVHHPDRLLHPMKRVGEKGGGREAFVRIGWEEALDLTAEAFLKAEQRYGSETVWPFQYAGTMGLVNRTGINRLRHAKRYSRQNETICTRLAETGWRAGVGLKAGVDAREVADSEVIVCWGTNPVSTQVNLMHHISRARKEKGAQLVVVDPYRGPTAQQADLHMMVRPGTDGALAAAVVHVLLAEGMADRDYLARLTDWDRDVEAHFTTTTPAWAEIVTGIPEAQIRAFARLYGGTKKSYIRVGYGLSRHRNGAAAVHAISCLPSVTGAWTVRGGGALWGNGAIYALDKTLVEGLDLLDPATRNLDMSRFGPVMTGDARDLGEGPPVTALLIQNCNPAIVCPESDKCVAGLARDDVFTVVHEQFLTDTARYADVILPAQTFLEHPDVYQASGHTYLQVTKPVIEAPGECQHNHFVHCELAKRLGAAHPGFEMTLWEVMEDMLKRSGHPDPETIYQAGGHDCAQDFAAMHFTEGFPQPGGRFRFKPDWAALGESRTMPGYPGHWPAQDHATPDRPFRLVTAPARNYLNSSFTETAGSRKREGRPCLLTHPDDLAAMGAGDGDLLRMGNRLGQIQLHAKAFDGVQRGVVVCESIWPADAFPGGKGINTLTSADAARPAGGAVFHDTAVWVRPA